MIGGVVAVFFGLVILVLPETILTSFGLGTPNEGIVLERDLGATLIGLGLINWMARGATGQPLRALLVGNVVVQALEIVANGYELIAGLVPLTTVGGLVFHLVLGAIFVLAMRRAS